MSDPNVVQLTPDLIAELRARKVLREDEEQIELPAFKAGEERIGDLIDEERTIFIEIAVIDGILGEWKKEISARSAEKVAALIRSKETEQEVVDAMREDMVFHDHEEAEEFYSEIYRRDYLNSLLWYNVRARLGCFGVNLAVRHGFAVAKFGYKYRMKG